MTFFNFVRPFLTLCQLLLQIAPFSPQKRYVNTYKKSKIIINVRFELKKIYLKNLNFLKLSAILPN